MFCMIGVPVWTSARRTSGHACGRRARPVGVHAAQEVRTFATTTNALLDVRDWLLGPAGHVGGFRGDWRLLAVVCTTCWRRHPERHVGQPCPRQRAYLAGRRMFRTLRGWPSWVSVGCVKASFVPARTGSGTCGT